MRGLRPNRRTDPAPKRAKDDDTLAVAYRRLSAMTIPEMVDWIDIAIGGLGRNLTQFRTTRDPVFLAEVAQLVDLMSHATGEMMERTNIRGD